MSVIVPLEQKRQLAERVVNGGYYTDGTDLFEVAGIGATGCVTVRSVSIGGTRCFDICDFRRWFWLVKHAEEAA